MAMTNSLARITKNDVHEAIAQAQVKCIKSGDTAWYQALARAEKFLMRGLWLFDGTNLIVKSSKGETAYHVTPSTCECVAFQRNTPCWHRAARKALVNALAFEAKIETVLRVSPAEAANEVLNEAATDADAIEYALNKELGLL